MYLAVVAHWRELAVIAAACLLLLALAAPFLVGRTNVAVDLRLEPERVAAGESVAAGVIVKNIANGRLIPTTLEVPVGSSVHRYGIASLPAGGRHEESFTIRTEHRGVIAVGPATTRRGDPIGIFSRDMVWTPVREVLVRPADGAARLPGRRSAARPRGRLDRRPVAERPRLPCAARIRPRRRPATHPLALVGQGDGLRRRVQPAGAAIPRHPPQPRRDRGRRRRVLVGRPRRLRDGHVRGGVDRRTRRAGRVRGVLRLR